MATIILPKFEGKPLQYTLAEEAGHRQREALLAGTREYLEALEKFLGNFEQTTHGMIPLGDEEESIGECLTKFLKNPEAYTTSCLSQAIRNYLKKFDSSTRE